MPYTRTLISALIGLAVIGCEKKPEVPAVNLAADEPTAGEERSFEIAAEVKMVFCWIPAGEAQLGSPKAERDAVLKTLIDAKVVTDGKEPDWLSSEAEVVRGKIRTKGFWLAKYPVTQEEWEAVMGDNPSHFDGKSKNNAKDLDTHRFPVETVSWNNCQQFLAKLNRRGGVSKVFGKLGEFTLPHEVFLCRVSATDFVRLRSRLYDLINLDEDQVLFIPMTNSCLERMEAIGRPTDAHDAKDKVIVV